MTEVNRRQFALGAASLLASPSIISSSTTSVPADLSALISNQNLNNFPKHSVWWLRNKLEDWVHDPSWKEVGMFQRMSIVLDREPVVDSDSAINMRKIYDTLPWYDVPVSVDVSICCNNQLPKSRVKNQFQLRRVANHIAKISRRGVGRYILSKDKRIIDRILKGNEDNYYTIIEEPLLHSFEAVVAYSGGNMYDKLIAKKNDGLYIHPDYQKYMRRIRV